MDLKVVGQRIKTARENAHITQEELASAVSCTPQHISAIERGVKTPRLDTFITIANTLNVPADTLLKDVLTHSPESMYEEFFSAMSGLSGENQFRLLRAIRAFSEEI